MSLPKECNPIASKWIFKLKEGSTIDPKPRYKVRLVAKGFTQREGIDSSEIFSPVLNKPLLGSFCLWLSNLELVQQDVKIVFLNEHLEETIYMV